MKHKNPLRFVSQLAIIICAAIPMILAIAVFLSLYVNDFDGQNTYYFGYKPTIVLTGSMEPVIHVNGMVVLEDCTIDEVEVGDIVRYFNGRMYILHRVVDINTDSEGKTYLTTQGDANDSPDSYKIYEESLMGRTVAIWNGSRDFLTFFFGEFDVKNITGSLMNISFGLIKLTALVVILILLGVWLFEMVSINYFFYRKPDSMQRALEWMDERRFKNDFYATVDKYREAIKHGNIIQKIILLCRFRKYYDVLCSEESKALKAQRKLQKLNKSIDNVIVAKGEICGNTEN